MAHQHHCPSAQPTPNPSQHHNTAYIQDPVGAILIYKVGEQASVHVDSLATNSYPIKTRTYNTLTHTTGMVVDSKAALAANPMQSKILPAEHSRIMTST
jgi:hypothetical protein